MKTQSILKSAILAVGFSAFALVGGAQAQVINVNIDGSQGAPLDGTPAGPTAGVLSYSGTTWTDTDASSVSDLPDSNGTPTIVGFSDDGTYNGNEGNSSTLPIFHAGDYTTGTMTLTLSGLTDGTNYDLVIYSNYSNASGSLIGGGIVTINSIPLTSTGEADPTTFDNGGDYVEFTNIQSSGGFITATITPNTTGSNPVGMFNGFQLEAVTVPEPSTLALVGLGALGLAFLIRRHRTA